MEEFREDRGRLASRLGSQAGIVFLGNLFSLAVGLPLQVYVARVLGAGGLGTFSLLEGGVTTLSGILAFGIASTVVRYIPEHLEKHEYGCVRKLLWRSSWILATVGLLAYLLVLMAVPWIDDLWSEFAHHSYAIVIMGILVPLGLLSVFLQQALRAFQEIRYMVLGTSVLRLSVKAILTVLLFIAGLKLIGYIVAVVAATAISAFWMFLGLRRKVRLVPKEDANSCAGQSSSWRRYAAVLYGKSLLDVGSKHLDRFLLGFFAGTSAVGVLAVVRQLEILPAVFLRMFLMVAAPMFAAAHARGEHHSRQRIYHLTTDWVVRAALPLLAFLMLFSGSLLAIFGDEFVEEGTNALRVLLAAQAFNILTGPVIIMLNMSDLEGKVLRLATFQTVLTGCGLLTLVPAFGLIGGAVSIAAGVVFVNLGALVAARRLLHIKWWDRRDLRWVVPTASVLAAGLCLVSYLNPQGAIELLSCLLALYTVFFGVSIAQGLHEDDREFITHLWAKIRIVGAR